MSGVSQQEKDDMMKFLTLGMPDFNQAAATVERSGSTVTEGFNNRRPESTQSGTVGKEDVDAMAKLLEAANLLEEPASKKQRPTTLMESVPASNNTSLGWGVRSVLNESTQRVKSYSVMHEGIGTVIADGLKLQESAHLLMNLLNEGATINSQDITAAIYMEKMYVDAASKMVKARKSGKNSLAEKYKQEAAKYRTEIKNML